MRESDRLALWGPPLVMLGAIAGIAISGLMVMVGVVSIEQGAIGLLIAASIGAAGMRWGERVLSERCD